jgi:hypothetical protein
MMEANLRLSNPELIALLRGLRIRTVLGLPSDPFEGLNDEQSVDLLAKGLHRFCHLRKYGDPSDVNNPRMADWGKVAAILTVSGFCTNSIVVSQRVIESQKKSWRVWHRNAQAGNYFVEYNKLPCGFHEFKAIESKDKLYDSLWFYLPHGLFPEGTKGISEVASRDLLEKKDFELEDENLLRALKIDGTWTTISSIKYEGGQRPDSISFLSTENHAWLVSENKEKLFFIPCTLGKLKLNFLNLISAFMH